MIITCVYQNYIIIFRFRGESSSSSLGRINEKELKKIKVEIHRNTKIDPKNASNSLDRTLLNPEEIVIRRREGKICLIYNENFNFIFF